MWENTMAGHAWPSYFPTSCVKDWASRVYGGFMEDLRRIYAGLMEDLCRIYGGFMEDYGGFMEGLWKIMSVSKRNVFFYFIMRGVIWRAAPAKFKTGMCEMNRTFSDLKFVVCLGTLVQDGLAHMRGVTWRAVPAKFKTDVWDENLKVWGFVMYLWEVGSGWVGTNVRCNMESCSGKVQNRDVWDESLRPKDVKFSDVSLGLWFRMGWHKCVA